MCTSLNGRLIGGNNPPTVDISLTDILAPFLSIIRSLLSTGPITSAALSALHSFFSCGLFLIFLEVSLQW
jgi:hypothetical protein